jgi:hypothetical protein
VQVLARAVGVLHEHFLRPGAALAYSVVARCVGSAVQRAQVADQVDGPAA